MAFGKLPGSAEIRAVKLREVRSTYRAWETYPPPHRSLRMLLAAQTNWKPKEREGEFVESSPQELAAFAASVGLRPATK